MENKVFFMPGDVVTLRQDIPDRPKMVVIRKETQVFRVANSEDPYLRGIRCFWFTKNGERVEALFNTKDLVILHKAIEPDE